MSEHLSLSDLRRYARGDASPAELLAMDDHLAECERCREELGPDSPSKYSAWRFSEIEDCAGHLTHEQLVACVENKIPVSGRLKIESHLAECMACSEEMADLAQFRGRLQTRRHRWIVPTAVAAALVAGVWLWKNLPATRTTSVSTPPPVARFELPANWSIEDRTLVEQAMNTGALPFGPVPSDLAVKPGTLLGTSSSAGFAPISPLGVMVASDRPEFRWQPLAGASSYRVEIYDTDFGLAARSPPIAAMSAAVSWTAEKPLDRGKLYRWQVVAAKSGGTVTAPAPPVAEARFRILDQAMFDRIDRARVLPSGHLLAAVLFAQFGMRGNAARELEALDPETRRSPQVRALIESAETEPRP